MANSVAAVFIKDELAIPKTLEARHRFWDKLPFVNVPAGTKVLCVKVKFDRGAPGSPSTFTEVHSGHDSYGLSFLPGLENGGMTVVQNDTEGGGTGKRANAITRGGALDGSDDTKLSDVPNDEIDLAMMNSDVVFISYDVNATDYSDLLDEAFALPLPDPT